MTSEATTRADPIASSPVYPSGSRVNDRGRLEVGGCDVVEVAREFGTPAYIYATDDVRDRARTYLRAFGSRSEDFEVVYASKAAPITALCALLNEEGLSIDVASGGELHVALRAGFDPARIHMHGNNKSEAELRAAVDSGVGHVICDSLTEIGRLDRICGEAGRRQAVLIRVTPGVKADTHTYVQTGQLDSKFGFGLADGLAAAGIDAALAAANLELVGLHAHIGSQIFELEPYVQAIEALAGIADPAWCRVLNVGGGLGIAYAAADDPPSIDAYAEVKVGGVQRIFDPVPRIVVEPGRSLVGNAGITAYTVGTVKEIPGVRTYVAVDGGMSDNLRPMLYGSRYEAILADRAAAEAETTVTIAGMHCESSDMLVRDARLAAPRIGDILVTPATGAYGYSMANNYNAVPRPPVIFCAGGDARQVVRRENYEDLTSRDE
ncbi:MAG: diaminopimelate decarboxylase [Solirubrobacterales bacterium]|jgi:diaminopimelate decarboxylase|nr:diaminopimelate decarboxylase [Solirubrobacterales bacterium]